MKRLSINKTVFYTLMFFLCIGSGLLYSGCNRKSSITEFIQTMNSDDDLVKKNEDTVYQFTCGLRPAEMMAIMDMRDYLSRNRTIPAKKYEETCGTYSNAWYFQLTLHRRDGADIVASVSPTTEHYMAVVNALTYYGIDQLCLLTGSGDTISAIIYDYQRSYGLSPDVNILIGFPKDKGLEKGNDFELIYDGRLLGITRPVRFRYSKEQLIKRMPQLAEVI